MAGMFASVSTFGSPPPIKVEKSMKWLAGLWSGGGGGPGRSAGRRGAAWRPGGRESERFFSSETAPDRVSAEWKEEDHPRDERGRFGEGGGGDASGDEDAEYLQCLEDKLERVLITAIQMIKKALRQAGREFRLGRSLGG